MVDKQNDTPNLGAEALEQAKHDFAQAQAALTKLPILGPAVWLYGRDSLRKFSFMADIDWLLLPPVVLDQCRLFNRGTVPHGFFTWALVDDAVDARLRSGVPRLAPHEWKGGKHLWLIDMVVPFGGADEMVAELRQSAWVGQAVNMLRPDMQQGGKLVVHTWPALESGAVAK